MKNALYVLYLLCEHYPVKIIIYHRLSMKIVQRNIKWRWTVITFPYGMSWTRLDHVSLTATNPISIFNLFISCTLTQHSQSSTPWKTWKMAVCSKNIFIFIILPKHCISKNKHGFVVLRYTTVDVILVI